MGTPPRSAFPPAPAFHRTPQDLSRQGVRFPRIGLFELADAQLKHFQISGVLPSMSQEQLEAVEIATGLIEQRREFQVSQHQQLAPGWGEARISDEAFGPRAEPYIAGVSAVPNV